MNMSDDFAPSMPAPTATAKKSKGKGKALVESSDFAIGELAIGFMWAAWKQPGKTIVGVFGIMGVISAIGPFVMGFAGFEVAPNAPLNERVANSASMRFARPVMSGAVYAVTEASLRQQNQYVNPQNTGTLTPTQVKALQTQMNQSRGVFITYKKK